MFSLTYRVSRRRGGLDDGCLRELRRMHMVEQVQILMGCPSDSGGLVGFTTYANFDLFGLP